MSAASDAMAREARNFVTANRFAALSTLSVSQSGFPFGSVAPYDVLDDGSLVIYVSLIAEHYRNLQADARASLCIFDPYGILDIQSNARATVLLRFSRVPEDQDQELLKRYAERFPEAVNYEIAHNFVLMRGMPEKVRWIGGFGRIAWISRESYLGADPDPLAYKSAGIIEHMNQDHADAMEALLLARFPGTVSPLAPVMTGFLSTHMTIEHRSESGRKRSDIEFSPQLRSAEEARSRLIEMLKETRRR